MSNWYLLENNDPDLEEEIGPFNDEAIRAMARNGFIHDKTLMREESKRIYRRAGEYRELLKGISIKTEGRWWQGRKILVGTSAVIALLLLLAYGVSLFKTGESSPSVPIAIKSNENGVNNPMLVVPEGAHTQSPPKKPITAIQNTGPATPSPDNRPLITAKVSPISSSEPRDLGIEPDDITIEYEGNITGRSYASSVQRLYLKLDFFNNAKIIAIDLTKGKVIWQTEKSSDLLGLTVQLISGGGFIAIRKQSDYFIIPLDPDSGRSMPPIALKDRDSESIGRVQVSDESNPYLTYVVSDTQPRARTFIRKMKLGSNDKPKELTAADHIDATAFFELMANRAAGDRSTPTSGLGKISFFPDCMIGKYRNEISFFKEKPTEKPRLMTDGSVQLSEWSQLARFKEELLESICALPTSSPNFFVTADKKGRLFLRDISQGNVWCNLGEIPRSSLEWIGQGLNSWALYSPWYDSPILVDPANSLCVIQHAQKDKLIIRHHSFLSSTNDIVVRPLGLERALSGSAWKLNLDPFPHSNYKSEILTGPPGMKADSCGMLSWNVPDQMTPGAPVEVSVKLTSESGTSRQVKFPIAVLPTAAIESCAHQMQVADRSFIWQNFPGELLLKSDAASGKMVVANANKLYFFGPNGLDLLGKIELNSSIKSISVDKNLVAALLQDGVDLCDMNLSKIVSHVSWHSSDGALSDIALDTTNNCIWASVTKPENTQRKERDRVFRIDLKTSTLESTAAWGCHLVVVPESNLLFTVINVSGYPENERLKDFPEKTDPSWVGYYHMAAFAMNGRTLKPLHLYTNRKSVVQMDGRISLSVDRTLVGFGPDGNPWQLLVDLKYPERTASYDPIEDRVSDGFIPLPKSGLLLQPFVGQALFFNNRNNGVELDEVIPCPPFIDDSRLDQNAHYLYRRDLAGANLYPGAGIRYSADISPDCKSVVLVRRSSIAAFDDTRVNATVLVVNQVLTEPPLLGVPIPIPPKSNTAEQNQTAKSVPKTVSPPILVGIQINKKTPLSEVTSLRSQSQAKMDAKSLAEKYAKSVVTITTDQGSGTGFLIGANGYILTCDHVISYTSEINIWYRDSQGKQQKLPATVVAYDPAEDLALIKADFGKPMSCVGFELDRIPSLGEPVVVIGSPGIGDSILDSTLTTGVISSQSRTISGKSFLQTNAAVNPGNSGGPVFNENGNVFGIVALKAGIEGAGFIISPIRIQKFLMQLTETAKP